MRAASHGRSVRARRLDVLPAAGVTVSQTGRAYWCGHVVRGNPNDTASQRSNGGSRAIFAVWPGARSHRTGFALPGVSTATRLRRCLYLNKCMTSNRDVPRDCHPHWLVHRGRRPEHVRSECERGQSAAGYRKLKLRRESSHDPGSFNGRTGDFESFNPGSNPGPGAMYLLPGWRIPLATEPARQATTSSFGRESGARSRLCKCSNTRPKNVATTQFGRYPIDKLECDRVSRMAP